MTNELDKTKKASWEAGMEMLRETRPIGKEEEKVFKGIQVFLNMKRNELGSWIRKNIINNKKIADENKMMLSMSFLTYLVRGLVNREAIPLFMEHLATIYQQEGKAFEELTKRSVEKMKEGD